MDVLSVIANDHLGFLKCNIIFSCEFSDRMNLLSDAFIKSEFSYLIKNIIDATRGMIFMK